ncbi:hypothetical protein ARAF_2606 [Arsenophonus endosymbiont of Aleurodicus floccissimus]|uniref:hypothetical protein n=1 Tax=Arsenophonus endosymbiont of Aleurodicus floccissimus TaxID=2152761 RepID=UPI000E6B3959|nr:hypothetical protein [Arsenophonus endosymbiont of Aleurodicus floccissimus]SPP32441.1 hypothetical protein ARAF_2606 [Arsenophonus endosymbiont of Aleurodicus floccissimus]
MEETDSDKERKRFVNIGVNTLHYRREEKNIGIRAYMYNIIVFIALFYYKSSTKSYGLENTYEFPFHKNKLIKEVNSSDVYILPDRRIVAYYGNFNSRKMGVLGEYSPLVMWSKLKNEATEWNATDPTTPAIMALHYIAIIASNNPGYDGEYINRMNKYQIEKAISIAGMEKDTILFLDIQPGLSNLRNEVIGLSAYLKMPNVHLGIDPEFTMHNGNIPGKVIGSISYVDINYIIDYLSNLVEQFNLPPKVLIIHRFTKRMVIDFEKVKNSKNV